jgi:hypothetical protein
MLAPPYLHRIKLHQSNLRHLGFPVSALTETLIESLEASVSSVVSAFCPYNQSFRNLENKKRSPKAALLFTIYIYYLTYEWGTPPT